MTESSANLTTAVALSVLRALYGPRPSPQVFAPIGALDRTIFAVWSQQWPKLRRSFAFRTASSPFDNAEHPRFHLRVLISDESALVPINAQTSSEEPWLSFAVRDLQSTQATEFRRFLWRYGADLRRGIEKFRFLGNLFATTRTPALSGDLLFDTVSVIQRVLPNPDDGMLLKEDLFSWESGSYSLLPRADPTGTLKYFLTHTTESFPLREEKLLDAVIAEWPRDREQILAITETALSTTAGSVLANALVDRISVIAEPSTFLSETDLVPTLRRRVIALRPDLLDSEAISTIEPGELNALVGLLPAHDAGLFQRIVKRLLVVNDWSVVRNVFLHSATAALLAITERIQEIANGQFGAIPAPWIQGLNDRADQVLSNEFLTRLTSTSALSDLAASLGYDRAVVLRAGPAPWVAALQAARDDVVGERRQVFLAFLMSLVLYKPTPGSELILERTFEPLHTELASNRLSIQAFNLLVAHLPDVWSWQQWDTCLRLRIGVIHAYEKARLDKTSLSRLTSDRKVSKQLEKLLRGSDYDAEFMD